MPVNAASRGVMAQADALRHHGQRRRAACSVARAMSASYSQRWRTKMIASNGDLQASEVSHHSFSASLRPSHPPGWALRHLGRTPQGTLTGTNRHD